MSRPESFNIEEPTSVTPTEDGEIIVTPPPEFDFAVAPGARDSLVYAVNQPEFDKVVIDLSAVRFLDSSAVGLLVMAKRRVEESAKTGLAPKEFLLRCSGPNGDNERIRRRLMLYGLASIMDFEEPTKPKSQGNTPAMTRRTGITAVATLSLDPLA